MSESGITVPVKLSAFFAFSRGLVVRRAETGDLVLLPVEGADDADALQRLEEEAVDVVDLPAEPDREMARADDEERHHDDQERRNRETRRNETNADLETRRSVVEQHRFSLFQTLVAGDVDYCSKDDRAELIKLAKDALGIVLQLSNGRPREGVAAKLGWGSNGERRFTMDTGMDEVSFARKMEDIFVRLSGNRRPQRESFALCEEFRALERGERTQWINTMVNGGQNVPYKARVLCIALLQDAGVDDYDSLSLPNRVPDQVVTTILRNLAALPEGASAEEARDCFAVVRDLAGAEAGDPAYVPATSTAEFNAGIVSLFGNYNDRIFGAYKTLASEVLADARAVFGAEIVREDATIRSFADINEVQQLVSSLGEGVRATPEAMRDGLRAAALKSAAKQAISARIEARIAALGSGLRNSLTATNALNSRVPDLVGRLTACHSPAEVAAALDAVQDQIDIEVRRAAATQDCRKRFGDMVRAALSAKTNIPVSALGGATLSEARIGDLEARVVHKIILQEVPCETPEQIERAFVDEADRFAVERAAILEKAETLPLSDAAKGELRTWLLSQDKASYLDLDAILRESEKIDFGPLATALREGRPKNDVYEAMRPFARNIRASANALLANKVDEIGAPERGNVTTIIMIAALDRHPGIRTDLHTFFARPDVVADADLRTRENEVSYPSTGFYFFSKPQAAEANAELARQIADGAAPSVFAQALARAVAAELNLGPLPNAFGSTILRCLPDLSASLRAAQSPANVRAALDGSREAIRTLVRQEVRLAAIVRGATDAMAEKLAGRFNIEPAAARRDFGFSVLLADRMNKLKNGVMRGTYPGCHEADFSPETEAERIMNALVEEYVAKLVVDDGLQGVDDETRDAPKTIIRRESRPDKPFLDTRRVQRIAAKVNGASLLAALERLSADPFVLRVGAHFQQPEHQGHPLRATVASTLF